MWRGVPVSQTGIVSGTGARLLYFRGFLHPRPWWQQHMHRSCIVTETRGRWEGYRLLRPLNKKGVAVPCNSCEAPPPLCSQRTYKVLTDHGALRWLMNPEGRWQGGSRDPGYIWPGSWAPRRAKPWKCRWPFPTSLRQLETLWTQCVERGMFGPARASGGWRRKEQSQWWGLSLWRLHNTLFPKGRMEVPVRVLRSLVILSNMESKVVTLYRGRHQARGTECRTPTRWKPSETDELVHSSGSENKNEERDTLPLIKRPSVEWWLNHGWFAAVYIMIAESSNTWT